MMNKRARISFFIISKKRSELQLQFLKIDYVTLLTFLHKADTIKKKQINTQGKMFPILLILKLLVQAPQI